MKGAILHNWYMHGPTCGSQVFFLKKKKEEESITSIQEFVSYTFRSSINKNRVTIQNSGCNLFEITQCYSNPLCTFLIGSCHLEGRLTMDLVYRSSVFT